MDKHINNIIQVYKGGSIEPLDGDDVDDLCNIIKAKINLTEGNITNHEYEKAIINKYRNH